MSHPKPNESTRDSSVLIRPVDVARKLGISTRAAQRLLRLNKFPGAKLGRMWLIDKQQLDDFLKHLYKRLNDKDRDGK